ncbi:MAG TPA: UPF0236 family protein [Lentibacillus sp.]|uniref:UPF0236 family transposase-like protein n=1 Tax=Lentibacillus sp. TaxID=1925746 RepID=UPI002B4AFEBE|nr:UPF0236 family protein [Lentibacillus sp.]HLR61330.1 UPF0236 family protein [Lentibacillus sp.]
MADGKPDHQRYKYEEKQAASMDTVFGSVRVKRRKQEKGFETDWMRPMGSAESNMNFFSRRLKKMGYSWSENGLEAMTTAIIHRFDGTLGEELDLTSSTEHQDDSSQEETVSLKRLLKQKTRQSVGAIMGSMPVLWGKEPGSNTAQALRGLAGFQSP